MNLGKIKPNIFSDSMIIGFKNDWMLANNGKPLEFEVRIEKDQLVLSAKLAALDKTKGVVTNENM